MRYFRGWNIVAVGFLMQAASIGAINFSYGTLLVPLTQEYGASRMAMNLGNALMMLGSGLLSPLCAGLYGRVAIRPLITAGVAVFALGYWLIAASTAMWQVLLVYASFIAVAEVMLGMMTTNVMVTQWFERRRGLAIGICAIGTSFGGLVSPPIASYLVMNFGWRQAFIVLGVGAVALITPAVWLLVRSAPSAQERRFESPVAPSGEESGRGIPTSLFTNGELLRRPDFWMYSLFIAISYGVQGTVLINIVPFAMEHGTAYTDAVLLVSCVAGMAVVGKLLFGAYVDRISIGTAMLAGLAANFGSVVLMLAADSYPMFVIGSMGVGLALGGILPVWGVLVARVYGVASYGKALGLMRAVAIPLSLCGPVLAGWLHDRYGDYTVAFSILAGLLVVAGALLLAVRKLPVQAPATMVNQP